MNLYTNRRLEYNRLNISMLKKSVVNIVILDLFEAKSLFLQQKTEKKL
jgi:hypothetical protein